MSYLDTDTCLHCGKQFIKTRRDRKFCSMNCGVKHNVMVRKDMLKDLIIKYTTQEIEFLKANYPNIDVKTLSAKATINLWNLISDRELRLQNFKQVFLEKLNKRYEK